MPSDGGSRSAWSLLSVGMILVASIVLGYLVGNYLDRRLGTSPWLVLAGVLLGTAAGFAELFRTAWRHLK